MKNLKKLGITEINTREQRVIDGGVTLDENGTSCTEHGYPDFLKKLLDSTRDTIIKTSPNTILM